MNEKIKKFISISLWVAAILLLIRCFISWTDLKSMFESRNLSSLCYNLFGFIGEAIGITGIIMAVFNKWAWRWKWLRWTHSIPVLAQKYNGIFTSDYDQIERSGSLTINQTFLSINIQFRTSESSSRSLTASFSLLNGVQYLIYTYQNDPRGEIQDQSSMHYGTAMLNVTNSVELEGNYFTGRKTRGSMSFSAIA